MPFKVVLENRTHFQGLKTAPENRTSFHRLTIATGLHARGHFVPMSQDAYAHNNHFQRMESKTCLAWNGKRV